MLDSSRISVACATAVEARAARRELPGIRVIETGIALERVHDGFGDAVISCGLAGGLRPDVATGTIVIPEAVGRPDGTILRCDPEVTAALRQAADALGLRSLRDPLVTLGTLVSGSERALWARRGYVAVDMETGLLRAPRVGAVRVVLDTPLRELSREWLHPLRAMLKPQNWRDMLWLAREAPKCARVAARIVRSACETPLQTGGG